MEEGKGVRDKKVDKNEVILQLLDNEEGSFAKKESTDSKGSPVAESSSFSLYRNTQMGSLLKSKQSDNLRSSESLLELSTRWSLGRSEFSKPKSRLVEPPYPKDANFLEEKRTQITSSNDNASNSNSPNMALPNQKVNATPITPRTPRTLVFGEDEDEDEDEEDNEEVYKIANLKVSQRSGKKWRLIFMLEWITFVCILGFMIVSFTVHKLQNRFLWGLELWKWCVLALVILCGRLVTEWFMNVLVFFIEKIFLFKKKVLYFVHGVKKSVQAFIGLSLVLLTWELLFHHGEERSRKTTKILNYITRTLSSSLIGVTIWLAKTLLIKLLAASFQSSRFFDIIQESIFHQYILRTLSGPPTMEMTEMVGKTGSSGRLSLRTLNKENKWNKEEIIDVDKLKKIKQEKVSAWTMKGLINVIRCSGLSTTSYENDGEEGSEKKDKEINSEWEARSTAYQIFRNVAKPGNKYIEEEDLLRFMRKEEVENVVPLFEGAVETRKIKRKSLKNWLVKVYLERQSLVHSLNDAKTAVEKLNKLASVIVFVVIIIVWLLIMGFLTTKILVFISCQLFLMVFMFGNTVKIVFEAIIFVFVVHPFDVGDRCVIDGVQMVVEEMNILTTVFLRYDNEKIFYPNSVLASKPISNFHRSPEMNDSVEFSVDFSTSVESIGALKAIIKEYLESKPQHWRANHSVTVKGIEDVNKMKMALNVTHTINFQNYGDKSNRKSELVLELKKIFEDLDIKYNLPPQQVHLSYVGPATTSAQPI